MPPFSISSIFHVLWLPFGRFMTHECMRARIYIKKAWSLLAAGFTSWGLTHLTVRRNGQQDLTLDACNTPPPRPPVRANLTGNANDIPVASSLRGFRTDHEVFEVSQCQKPGVNNALLMYPSPGQRSPLTAQVQGLSPGMRVSNEYRFFDIGVRQTCLDSHCDRPTALASTLFRGTCRLSNKTAVR